MLSIIKSEFIKSKRTSTNKFAVFAPLLCILLAACLGGGQNGAYNWWYTMFLPGALAIISSQVMTREKSLSYKGISLYPIARKKVWLGKIIYIIILLTASNLIFMLGIIGTGFIFEPLIPFKANVFAILVLLITFLFQIPISLFLTAKFNMFIAVIVNVAMTILGVVSFGSSSLLALTPYGVSSALMAPILHILPNGLPVPKASPFLSGDMIIRDSLLTFLLFLILAIITTLWFGKKEVN